MFCVQRLGCYRRPEAKLESADHVLINIMLRMYILALSATAVTLLSIELKMNTKIFW